MKGKITVKTLLLGLVGGLLIVAVFYGGYAWWKGRQPEENGKNGNNTKPPIEYTWQTYQNDEFGFSFEYPKTENGIDVSEKWKVKDFGLVPGNRFSIGIGSYIRIEISKEGLTGVMPTIKENECNAYTDKNGKVIYKDVVYNAVIGGEKSVLSYKKYPSGENDYYYCLATPHKDLLIKTSMFAGFPGDDLVYKNLMNTFRFDDLKHSISIPNLETLKE